MFFPPKQYNSFVQSRSQVCPPHPLHPQKMIFVGELIFLLPPPLPLPSTRLNLPPSPRPSTRPSTRPSKKKKKKRSQLPVLMMMMIMMMMKVAVVVIRGASPTTDLALATRHRNIDESSGICDSLLGAALGGLLLLLRLNLYGFQVSPHDDLSQNKTKKNKKKRN